ncbi:Alpha/Beta hydrolase protein [Mycena alexandri]|uniref:Alpha/Beta hydrolase protein n=1 Tax=Mycena alexandri TaxID=1745969 RepID=A0AAD6SQT1_9AGAR|nr:Alpha/Beta hydrolase protein [Mycena alexandri]
MAESPQSSLPSSIVQQRPLLTRLKYRVLAFALQNLIVGPSLFFRDVKAYFFPPAIRPDIIKTYPCRPRLPVRIFLPPHDPIRGAALFTIHGGGFMVGSPHDNDTWNAAFAAQYRVPVIGLNYAKTPANPYPGPTDDIEALLLAVLADPTLPPIRNAALLGWSAGGNLCASVAQRPAVRATRKIVALVPLYPVVDFTLSGQVKTAGRRYKAALGGYRGAGGDVVVGLGELFAHAYMPVGTDRRDPGLSPFFAPREALPKHIFVLGAELDMLAAEAWRAACMWAGRRVPEVAEVPGREAVVGKGELVLESDVDGDERFTREERERYAWEEKDEDKKGGVRWLLVPDTVHGFDQNIGPVVKDEVLMEDAQIKTQKTMRIIGEWLVEGAFKDDAEGTA